MLCAADACNNKEMQMLPAVFIAISLMSSLCQLSFILAFYLSWRFPMKKCSSTHKPVRRNSIKSTVRDALCHVLVFGVISIAGHVATGSLAQSAGALGMAIYPSVGGMSFTYGS